jgi:hypothetical protein
MILMMRTGSRSMISYLCGFFIPIRENIVNHRVRSRPQESINSNNTLHMIVQKTNCPQKLPCPVQKRRHNTRNELKTDISNSTLFSKQRPHSRSRVVTMNTTCTAPRTTSRIRSASSIAMKTRYTSVHSMPWSFHDRGPASRSR